MKALFDSLRSRIIFFALLIGLIPIIVFGVTLSKNYEKNLIDHQMTELQEKGHMIAAELGRYEEISEITGTELAGVLSWYAEAFSGRIMIVQPDFRVLLDTYGMETSHFCICEEAFSAFEGEEFQNYSKKTQSVDCAVPVVHFSDDTQKVTGVLLFSTSTSWLNDSLKHTRLAVLLFSFIAAVVIGLIALYISYLIVRPIKRMNAEIQKSESGDTSADLTNLRVYKEIDDTRKSFAEVIKTYQQMEKNHNEFISNVSHELKTPMTSIRVLADSLIGQQNVEESVYQEFLSDISEEVDRESQIVEDLLAMSRIQKNANAVSVATISINGFVIGIMRRLRPIAQKRDIDLLYESYRDVIADVDEMKLSQAVTNLVENAIKYNNDGGYVKVSLDADHEYFYLKVEDNGVGIPKDSIDQIFERFYRVDKARSRETGGTGLGLYITKTIILMHYGTIKADSQLGKGTTFSIKIPLKHTRPKGGVTA